MLADDVKINDGTLEITSPASGDPALHVIDSSALFTNTLFRVDAMRSESADYWFARFNTAYDRADDSYVNVFSIRGDGYTTIEGELHVNNATSVHSLELKHGGFTINQGGLHVYRDGLVAYDGGADIRNNNLTVLRAHHNDATNAKDNGTVFVVESTAKFTSDINLIEAVMDVQTNNPKTVFRVNGLPKTYIDQGGLEVVGGVTIGSAGLNVSAGGIRVSAGGVQIKGGNLTVGSDIKLSGIIAVGANQVVSSQQASVSDVDATNDPGDGTFSTLSTVADLATECENLRDLVDEIRTQMNDLLGKLRAHGLIAT